MLRAVIFDFNGIIVDDEPIHFRLFQKVFAEEGIALSEADYYTRYLGFDDRGAFGHGFADHQQSIGQSKMAELIARKASYYQEAIRNHVDIFPGVKALIPEIAQAYPLAVASGALRNEIETILRTAGLVDYFHAIVAAEDVTHGKPEPEVFLKALAQINDKVAAEPAIAAHECVVIEDSKEGIKGARRAGMQCLAVTNSHPAELLGEASRIVASLEAVNLDVLKSLCGAA